jgi:DnaJ-class molecular chaperone
MFIRSIYLLLLSHAASSFIVTYDSTHRTNISFSVKRTTNCVIYSTRNRNAETPNNDSHYLLQEFSIASGEIINPYEVLKVSRKATREEIRASYLKQSRRYHPDGFRNSNNRNMDILPGNCNNLDDVRDQWERVKLSYEILSNPKTRKRYDRHDVLSSPNAAIQRAVLNTAWDGITNVGKGIFTIGSFVVQAVSKNTNSSNVQSPE